MMNEAETRAELIDPALKEFWANSVYLLSLGGGVRLNRLLAGVCCQSHTGSHFLAPLVELKS